jgi:hypothetical protein
VILSFGGADGQYLESACSETGMYNLVKNVMITQNIHNLDFDVEGSQLDNTALNTTRNNVIKRLQADFPDLYVFFTLPVDTTGLPGDALTLLESAHTAGVNVSVVSDQGSGCYKILNTNAARRLISPVPPRPTVPTYSNTLTMEPERSASGSCRPIRMIRRPSRS